jgi:hypothetical protein
MADIERDRPELLDAQVRQARAEIRPGIGRAGQPRARRDGAAPELERRPHDRGAHGADPDVDAHVGLGREREARDAAARVQQASATSITQAPRAPEPSTIASSSTSDRCSAPTVARRSCGRASGGRAAIALTAPPRRNARAIEISDEIPFHTASQTCIGLPHEAVLASYSTFVVRGFVPHRR